MSTGRWAVNTPKDVEARDKVATNRPSPFLYPCQARTNTFGFFSTIFSDSMLVTGAILIN